ncbi:MAG: patatin-like phospholipase family protein [Leptospiraceae bacterium]|nr:patatin-like phospholipase family protein [Leptospiraceae bacterium]MCP5498410.1 patatin-like phospholipase family protein [Leptospiraceae bacterium]
MDSSKSINNYYLIDGQALFHDLSVRQKSYIANRAQYIEYNKGEQIFRRGEKSYYFFIVVSGIIQTYLPGKEDSENEKDTNIEFLKNGDYFGMVSLLSERPHSLSARAYTDAELLRIDLYSFKEILEFIPGLGLHFSKILSEKVSISVEEEKKVFESLVVSVLCLDNNDMASRYSSLLGYSIVEESNKRAAVLRFNKKFESEEFVKIKPKSQGGGHKTNSLVIKSFDVDCVEEIQKILIKYIYYYHIIILDLPAGQGESCKYLLNESKQCHVIVDDNNENIENKNSFIRTYRQEKQDLPADFFYTVHLHSYSDLKELLKRSTRNARRLSEVRLGIAFGGGAAFGLAQIGVMKVLEKNHITIDMISGTSIGALLGSLWASGITANEIEYIAIGEFDSFFKIARYIDIGWPRKGLISGGKLRTYLDELLNHSNFRDLKVPLRVISCDISSRMEVVINHGKVVDGVMASIAIPGLFHPTLDEFGRILVDGGVVDPLPVNVIQQEGISRLIAVNAMPSSMDIVRSNISAKNIMDIIVNSLYSLQYRIAKISAREADVYLSPILSGASWYEFHRAKEFIDLGEKIAEASLEDIKKLAYS